MGAGSSILHTIQKVTEVVSVCDVIMVYVPGISSLRPHGIFMLDPSATNQKYPA